MDVEERSVADQLDAFLDHSKRAIRERVEYLEDEQLEGLKVAVIIYAPPPNGGGPLDALWAHMRTIDDFLDLAAFYREAAEQVATIEMDPRHRAGERVDLSRPGS